MDQFSSDSGTDLDGYYIPTSNSDTDIEVEMSIVKQDQSMGYFDYFITKQDS